MRNTPMSGGQGTRCLGAVAALTVLLATGCSGTVASTETAPDSDGGNPADASALDSQTGIDSQAPDAADAAETAVKPDASDASQGVDSSDAAESSVDAAEAAASDAAQDVVQEPIACPTGLSGCGTVCVDLQLDPQHCGSCDNVCAMGAACVSGVCQGCSTKVLLPGPPMITTDAISSLAIGDLDADGRADAVWVGESTGLLGVSKGNGDGTFAPPVYHAVTDSYSVDLADMDGDGRLDFVVGSGDTACPGRALIFRNDGTGTPLPPATYDFCRRFAVGDVNGDQRADVVATGTDVRVFLNKGDGTLDAPVVSAQEAVCRRVAIGDMDGDGKPELVGACDDHIKVYKNLGNGSFAQPWLYKMLWPQDVAVADFNGDSRLDLAAVAFNRVEVRLNLGYGALGPAKVLSPTQGSHRVLAIDANADGAVDILAGGNDGVLVHPGDGMGGFGELLLPVGSGSGVPRAVVDLTGDGLPEVVFTIPNGAAIALNRGYYGFEELAFLESDNAARGIEMEDLDKNGWVDIITAELFQGGLSVVMEGAQGQSAPMATYESDSGISGFALKDLNGDGVTDIAAVREGTGSVRVLLGQGNGAFALQGLWPAGTGARYVAAGDLNGDGKADLATANQGGTTSVMIGHGDGSFSAPTTYFGEADPSVPLIVDLNLDGAPDLVLGSETGSTLHVRTNAGDATFDAAIDQTSKCAAQGAAAGDLNGDGAPDIVLPACNDDDIVVFWNDGSGGLSEASIQAALGNPLSRVRARLGDVDGDGLPDIVVAVSNSHALTVLRNAGGGSFDPPAAYLADLGSTDFALADVDLTGRLGIVMTTYQKQRLVLVNNGPICTSP